MVEGYPYHNKGICLLLGEDVVFNEKTENFEFNIYKACIYSDGLPVDGSCTSCEIYKGLNEIEIESRLSKKPTDL